MKPFYPRYLLPKWMSSPLNNITKSPKLILTHYWRNSTTELTLFTNLGPDACKRFSRWLVRPRSSSVWLSYLDENARFPNHYGTVHSAFLMHIVSIDKMSFSNSWSRNPVSESQSANGLKNKRVRHRYSSVLNRCACTFIDFEKKIPPARPYLGLHVKYFLRIFPPARLFRPTRLFGTLE